MLDNIIVISYLFLTLFVGIFASKFVKSEDDYSTGGKNYSSLVIFATLSASFLGGGFTIGLAEKTFNYGIVFVLAIWGFSLKEILIAKFVAPRMHKFQSTCHTVGDVMEIGYGKFAKILTGIASLLCCGGIIGAQVSACGNIMHVLTGISPAIGSLLATGIVITYATIGGMKSVVIVDVLHFCILLIMVPIIMFFGFQKVGGIDSFFNALPTEHLQAFGDVGVLSFVVLFVSFFLGETLIPPYAQRLLIGKTSKETERGTLFSGILSIGFFLIIGIIGMLALVMTPDIESKFALPYVITDAIPTGFKGLAIAAMLAVIMSSADSFLNSTSTAIKIDLLKPLKLDRFMGLSALNTSRLVTLAIGVVAMLFALTTSSVIDILLYSYQFWTPFILIPLVAVIYGIRTSPTTFLISAIAGISTVVIWNITIPFSIGIDGALEGVIAGVVINGLTFAGLIYSNSRKFSFN